MCRKLNILENDLIIDWYVLSVEKQEKIKKGICANCKDTCNHASS